MIERDGICVRLRFDGPMTENILIGVLINGIGWLWGKSPVILGLGDKAWLEHIFSEIDTQIASRTK
jgi:predicted membrane-bound dolichyl-phosphate-mannose-protein mannosyltransferase